MTKEEAEEIVRDCLQGQRFEYEQELRLRNDFDYALDYFNISKDMTVGEFARALKKLKSYGWGISADELLESI